MIDHGPSQEEALKTRKDWKAVAPLLQQLTDELPSRRETAFAALEELWIHSTSVQETERPCGHSPEDKKA